MHNEQKTILIISRSKSKYSGGIETHISQLINYINSCKHTNGIIWVGNKKLARKLSFKKCQASKRSFSFSINNKINFLLFLISILPVSLYYLISLSVLKKKNPNLIIHIHSLSEQIMFTPIAYILRINTVWTIHGVVNFNNNYLLKFIFSRNALLTKKIISVSKSVYESIKEIKANHEIILNAVEIPSYRKRQEVNNFPRIVYVGRICFEKNFDYFINLMNKLMTETSIKKIIVAGDGPLYEKYRDVLSIPPYQYLGFINNLHKVWDDADFIIMPSFNFEGLPYVLLEAMSYGVIPIVSSIGPFKEVVTENKQGFYLALSIDKDSQLIKKLIINKKDMVRVSENARQCVKLNYNIKIFNIKIGKLYESLFCKNISE